MLWALACGGEQGATDLLRLMKRDISLTFALSGTQKFKNLLTENKNITIKFNT